MKHLKVFEEFDADDYKTHLSKLMRFLSDKDFEIYDGTEDLKSYFFEVANNDDLTANEKSSKITNYLEEKWGLYDGYEEVLEFLESLFMDEI